MARIFVCGLYEMPMHAERVRPQRLISLVPEHEQPDTPAVIAPGDHLRLIVDDVSVAGASPHAPDPRHIRALVRFLRETDGRSVMMHCMAGVSRSTAAALIALALEAPGREHEAATLLRNAAPHARPNRLMIELADRALRRKGRLVAALDAMGEASLPEEDGLVELPRSLGPSSGRRRTSPPRSE